MAGSTITFDRRTDGLTDQLIGLWAQLQLKLRTVTSWNDLLHFRKSKLENHWKLLISWKNQHHVCPSWCSKDSKSNPRILEFWKLWSFCLFCFLACLLAFPLNHQKMHFSDFRVIPHDLVILSNVREYKVKSQYAISSRSHRPNSRKWPKTSFLPFWPFSDHFWSIFVTVEWSSMNWWCCQI